MTTNEIRNSIKEKRNELTLSEIEKWSKSVLKNLLTLDFIKDKTNFFIYNSIKNEVDTAYLIDYLNVNNKVISYPLTIGDNMIAVLPTDREWVLGDFNVKIPKSYKETNKIDVAIIPLLACDKNLNRIGYGKGYYDKFLSKTDCIKVGICYDFQVIESITPNAFDVPLDYIVTPTKIITKWKNLLQKAEDFYLSKIIKN